MRLTKESIEKWRNRVSAPLGHCLVSARKDDSYIAGFPRSGSTWLRTILTNIVQPDAVGNPDVFNATIPAVSIRNSFKINKLSSPRLIMTHGTWRPEIRKVIYIVRDGRDVLISLYHYQTTRRGVSLSEKEFMQSYNNGVFGMTWAQNIYSWLVNGASTLGNDLMVLRFEDMKENTQSVIERTCEFLMIETSRSDIELAIKHASLENARYIEQARQGQLDNANASFYRSGCTQQWKLQEYKELIVDFIGTSSSAMKIAGYA